MTPESEVERWLRNCIPSSPFASITYAVGGYVRDQVLGLESKDFDVVVEKHGGAHELAEWLHAFEPKAISHPHQLGSGYPIWQVVFKDDLYLENECFRVKGAVIEIADTQSEAFPDPKTRQRITVFGNLEEDCRRRDFTTNMLYRDLTNGQIVDPSGRGLEDIRQGILRGHPQVDLEKIFKDDPLRMIRLIRFHCRFGWTIPSEVLEKVRICAERVQILSAERVRDEFIKIMELGKLWKALELLRSTSLLKPLFPELLPMIGCTQDCIYHSEGDVWTHTLLVLKNSRSTVPLQLAALLHDIGKPDTRSEHGERIKFLGHELISAQKAEEFMLKLKFDHATVKKVKKLVLLHLRGGDVENWAGLKPARKLIREAGEELDELIQLIYADSSSSLGKDGKPRLSHVDLLKEKLKKAVEIPLLPKPVLSGREVMQILGVAQGKKIGEILEFLQYLEDEWAEKGLSLDKTEAEKILRENKSRWL